MLCAGAPLQSLVYWGPDDSGVLTLFCIALWHCSPCTCGFVVIDPFTLRHALLCVCLLNSCAAAPVYVVNGAGGNREGNELPKGAAWSAWRSQEVGFGYIVVAGPHSLTYNFVAANGTTLHNFEITK